MVVFHEAGTKKFFRKYAAQEDRIKDQITQMMERQMETAFSKTKAAGHLLFEGQKIWELRVNPGTLPPVRVAFIRSGKQFIVLYLSNSIQKSEFLHDLEKFLKHA